MFTPSCDVVQCMRVLSLAETHSVLCGSSACYTALDCMNEGARAVPQ